MVAAKVIRIQEIHFVIQASRLLSSQPQPPQTPSPSFPMLFLSGLSNVSGTAVVFILYYTRCVLKPSPAHTINVLLDLLSNGHLGANARAEPCSAIRDGGDSMPPACKKTKKSTVRPHGASSTGQQDKWSLNGGQPCFQLSCLTHPYNFPPSRCLRPSKLAWWTVLKAGTHPPPTDVSCLFGGSGCDRPALCRESQSLVLATHREREREKEEWP